MIHFMITLNKRWLRLKMQNEKHSMRQLGVGKLKKTLLMLYAGCVYFSLGFLFPFPLPFIFLSTPNAPCLDTASACLH